MKIEYVCLNNLSPFVGVDDVNDDVVSKIIG